MLKGVWIDVNGNDVTDAIENFGLHASYADVHDQLNFDSGFDCDGVFPDTCVNVIYSRPLFKDSPYDAQRQYACDMLAL